MADNRSSGLSELSAPASGRGRASPWPALGRVGASPRLGFWPGSGLRSAAPPRVSGAAPRYRGSGRSSGPRGLGCRVRRGFGGGSSFTALGPGARTEAAGWSLRGSG
jgi:hypothetical protein